MVNHASLFSGIGEFDLAASWMGWENVFQSEIDPFCNQVLEHHFPTTTRYEDIRNIDGTEWRGQIDILTGGFPCQPFSAAGKRRGTDDNRFLWPEMLRIICEVRPTWIVAENVRGITSIEQGMVFERVCSELEENEYEVQPFCIPACSVQAPHKRERIWFIAHYTGKRLEGATGESLQRGMLRPPREASPDDTNAIGTRLEGGSKDGERHGRQSCGDGSDEGARWSENWLEAATRLCRVDDGLPRELHGITVPRWRKESIKAYGNSIVPQVAYQIFQSIPALNNG